MNEVSYSDAVCPSFKLKNVAYFGVFKHITSDGIDTIIKNSKGFICKSVLDKGLNYIILSNDSYFRYVRKIFKSYEYIELIYEHVMYCNKNLNKIEVISETQLLKMCNIQRLENVFPRYLGRHLFTPLSDYIVLDMISTGFDYNLDDIIQISALKIINNSILDEFTVNIKQSCIRRDYVISVVRGYEKKPLIIYSLEEALIRYIKFTQNLPIVSCNTLLKNNFIFYCYNKFTLKCITNDYVDIFQLMSNLYPNMKKVNLNSISKKVKYNLDYSQLDPIDWCENIHYTYQALKKKLSFKDTSNFIMNTFKNKTFVLEGIFESVSRNYICDTISNFGGKVSQKLSSTADYLLLSNVSYCEYLNGKKSKKQVMAESFIMRGTRLNIISESTIKSMLYYNLIESNSYYKYNTPNSLLDLLCY